MNIFDSKFMESMRLMDEELASEEGSERNPLDRVLVSVAMRGLTFNSYTTAAAQRLPTKGEKQYKAKNHKPHKLGEFE